MPKKRAADKQTAATQQIIEIYIFQLLLVLATFVTSPLVLDLVRELSRNLGTEKKVISIKNQILTRNPFKAGLWNHSRETNFLPALWLECMDYSFPIPP